MKLHACRSQCVCVLFVDLLSMAILLWHLVISCRICSIRPLSSQSLRCLRKMLSLHFWEIFGNAVCLLALLHPFHLTQMSCSKGQGHCTAPSIPRLNQDLIVGQASIAKCGGKTNDACELRMSGPVWLIPVPMGLHMSYIALPVTLTYMLSRPHSMHLFCLCPNAAYLMAHLLGYWLSKQLSKHLLGLACRHLSATCHLKKWRHWELGCCNGQPSQHQMRMRWMLQSNIPQVSVSTK